MTTERSRATKPAPNRPWPGRHDQPLEGRRIWDVGDWGNASNYIGRRWEENGLTYLRNTTSAYADLVEILGTDLQDLFSRLGLTNPDALLIECHEGAGRIRAVDCKWSVETASPRQVEAASLESLLPHLEAALAGHRECRLVIEDGFFFAPSTEANKRFLSSAQNYRRGDPITPSMVVFEEVDAADFFERLPGWDVALRLAAMDRGERLLATPDGAERYYRLGAGIAGALRRLATPIFADEAPAEFEPLVALESLREPIRPFTVPKIVSYLGRRLDDRSEWLARLRQVWRCPYSMRSMARTLEQAGIRIPDPYSKDPAHAAALAPWRNVHRLIGEDFKLRVNAEGLRLIAAGDDEFSALATLEHREHDRTRWARDIGDRLTAAAIQRYRDGLSPAPTTAEQG